MRNLPILVSLFMVSVLSTGCRTAVSKGYELEPYAVAFTHMGIEVGTLKALDAGDTNKAYRVTLIQLKDSTVWMHSHYRRGAFPERDRSLVQSTCQVVLDYLERQKERLGQEPETDHCGLEIADVLSATLSQPQEQARVKVLRDYFSSRFVYQ
jgi:hypothetical protein